MVTNEEIIRKLATLEANFINMSGAISTIQKDIAGIKKDTASFGLVKSIVFGFIVIIVLAFMGALTTIIIPHQDATQASTLPATQVQIPKK